MWKAEAAILNPRTTHLGSVLGLAEMTLSGVTTVMDMFWHPYETVRAAREIGVRISTGGIIFDPPGVTGQSVEERFTEAERFFEDFADADDVNAGDPAARHLHGFAGEPAAITQAGRPLRGGCSAPMPPRPRAEVEDITNPLQAAR